MSQKGRVKTLALNDLYAIDFDIITYADMLYWIEKFNKDDLTHLVPLTVSIVQVLFQYIIGHLG